MITSNVHPHQLSANMQADPDEELEHLKELLAEAEEVCLLLALEKHFELQRFEFEAERLSRKMAEEDAAHRVQYPRH